MIRRDAVFWPHRWWKACAPSSHVSRMRRCRAKVRFAECLRACVTDETEQRVTVVSQSVARHDVAVLVPLLAGVLVC